VKEIKVFEVADSTALLNPARLPKKSRFAIERAMIVISKSDGG
jgi:hypothetical protein